MSAMSSRVPPPGPADASALLPDASGSTHGSHLEIIRAEKAYGNVTVLKGVDLVAEAGKFLTLLGPSGSGKTTLLNSVAGLDHLDSGDILMDGNSITKTPADRRGFGMVFQSYSLFPHMTVAANVEYPLRIRRVPRNKRAEAVGRQLAMVQLEAFADRLPGQLSGGQQQRVALARAMVFHPRVLLMDEPLGALDRRLRESLQFEIRGLQQRLGITVVYVTHDQQEALTMSDKIAVLDKGRLAQIGTPEEIYQFPRSEFVATAVGDMVQLTVEIDRVGPRGGVVCRLPHGTVIEVPAFPGSGQIGLVPGHSATLALRPESVSLAPHDEHAQPDLSGVVTSTAFMGGNVRYEVAAVGLTLVSVAPVGARDIFNRGDHVAVSLDRTALRVFSYQ